MDAVFDSINRVWNLPSKEFLIVKDYKIHPQTKDLYKFLNVNTLDNDFSLQPINTFLYLLTNPENNLIKIDLNDYQEVEIKGNQQIIKLKFPTIVTPENVKSYNYIRNIKRHPQLRRLVVKYLKSIDWEYNLEKLRNLNPTNEVYDYMDADEVVLYKNYEGTYFELLPLELKKIICDHVDSLTIFENDKMETSNPIQNALENITNIILDTNNQLQDASILDIYNNLSQSGKLNELQNFIGDGNSFLNYFRNGNILSDLSSIIQSKI